MTKAKDKFTGQFISQREQTFINNINILEEQVKDWELRYNAGEKYAIETQQKLKKLVDVAQREWNNAEARVNEEQKKVNNVVKHYETMIQQIKKRNKNNTWLGIGIGILITVILEILKYNLYAK